MPTAHPDTNNRKSGTNPDWLKKTRKTQDNALINGAREPDSRAGPQPAVRLVTNARKRNCRNDMDEIDRNPCAHATSRHDTSASPTIRGIERARDAAMGLPVTCR